MSSYYSDWAELWLDRIGSHDWQNRFLTGYDKNLQVSIEQSFDWLFGITWLEKGIAGWLHKSEYPGERTPRIKQSSGWLFDSTWLEKETGDWFHVRISSHGGLSHGGAFLSRALIGQDCITWLERILLIGCLSENIQVKRIIILKGPKHEIFGSGFFTLIKPIWISDLGTSTKNLKWGWFGPFITL